CYRDWSSDVCSSDLRRLHAFGGTAQGKQAGELPVQPAGEMAHRGIDTHERGLRQLLPLQRLQERLGHGDKPLVRPVMRVEMLIEIGRASCRERVKYS